MRGRKTSLLHASVLLLVMILLGCGGPVRLSYRVISPDALPDQLADWRQLPTAQIDVRDAVVGADTYVRIAVGPCPSKELKVKKVLAGGPRLTVVTDMDRRKEEQQFSVLYLKLDWETRTRFGPEFLTLQINDWTQTFFAYERDRSASEAIQFRPAATYEPAQAFRCTNDAPST